MTLISGALALVYGIWLIDGPQSWHRSVAKTLPVALLALAAFFYGFWGLALALALSALGDWCLSFEGEKPFLAGLVSFALAHVLFVVLLLPLWQGVPWGLGLILGVVALSTFVWLLPYAGALKLPVLVYVLLICAMGIAAWAQPNGLIRAGASAFILSDFLLALGVFRQVPHTSRPLWALYWAGQALLFAGLMAQ
jgi:uncharacterized membrane protein YhhN